jgi:hypothetical protein
MLAAVLLVSGVLLVRAFSAVRHTDPGYRPPCVRLLGALPGVKYPDGPARMAFWNRKLSELCDIRREAAGVISCPPLSATLATFSASRTAPNPPGQSDPVTPTRVASDATEAMGIRLKFGRFFDAKDGREGGERSSSQQTFVRTFWASERGREAPQIQRRRKPWITVVGVARRQTLRARAADAARPVFPPRQMPEVLSTLAVAIRTTGDPEAFASTARSILHELDPMVRSTVVRRPRGC